MYLLIAHNCLTCVRNKSELHDRGFPRSEPGKITFVSWAQSDKSNVTLRTTYAMRFLSNRAINRGDTFRVSMVAAQTIRCRYRGQNEEISPPRAVTGREVRRPESSNEGSVTPRHVSRQSRKPGFPLGESLWTPGSHNTKKLFSSLMPIDRISSCTT
jgi:hypothetical protein